MVPLNQVGAILVSYYCCNRLPQTQWLKMANANYLTVWEIIILKLRCQQGCVPSEVSRGICFLTSPASRSHPHFLALVPSFIVKASGITSLNLSFNCDILLPSSTFKGPLWLITLGLPIYPGYFKVSWLTTLIPSATWIPPCHVT